MAAAESLDTVRARRDTDESNGRCTATNQSQNHGLTLQNLAAPRPLSELTNFEAWSMVESSPDGMMLADEDGIILFVNQQIETMFGFDRGELSGRAVEVLLPEGFREVHKAHRTRYRVEPVVRSMGNGFDVWARRKDGLEFPVEVSLSPIAAPDGLRIVATVRDIGDRLAGAAHAHNVLHAIDQAHDAVFMFGPKTMRFEYVNRGAIELLGYDRAELLTMSPLHIAPEFTEASFMELLDPILNDIFESRVFTTVHRRKDGTDVPVEINLEYPPAAKGSDRDRMLVAVARDITDRLVAEHVIRAGEAEVAALEERERLARDLHDFVIQQLFATGMALQSACPLITDALAAHRVSRAVDQLDDTIRSLRSTISGLNTPPSISIACQLDTIMKRAAHQLRFEPSMVIQGDLDAMPVAVVEELIPSLSEALSNVARHARATAADVQLVVRGNHVRLTVTDNGIGFDAQSHRGNGLDNLQSRASRVNGSAVLTNRRPGTGTVLTWTANLGSLDTAGPATA